MVVDIFLIALIMVLITDVSGFWDSMEVWLSKRLKFKVALPKICVCSLCQTHWAGLLYLIITSQLSLLSYSTVLLIAVSTPLIYNIIVNLRDILGLLINIPMTFFKQ